MQQNGDPDSNVTIERRQHSEKQPWQSSATGEGRQIDASNEQPSNTQLSIHDSLESFSNITVARDSQPAKILTQSLH
jgi:hypothetical protein